MKHLSTIGALVTALAGVVLADGMKEDFREPPDAARPRAYWNWLNGAVSLPALTRDLEEALDKGLGGLEMWDCEAMRNPEGFVPAGPPFMGPESVKAMHHAMREADRLGLELGLVTSSGWNAGGPWVPPALASKNLFVSNLTLEGPAVVRRELPFPKVPEACPKDAAGRPKWSLEVAVFAWPDRPDKMIPDPASVIDLSDRVEEGVLSWDVPEGRWHVARFVCSNNGQQLIAASPNSKGPFIDFLDPEATRFHFGYIIDKLGLEKGGDPSPLKYLEVDSMELHPGIQWTPKFPDWFEKQHGYDPRSWLPALAGWTMVDEETSERFRYDFRKSVSDLLIHSHYTTGSEVCAEYGLELAGEAGGPGPPIWDTCPVDSLKALGNVDVPRGEFWVENRHNIFLVKEIASASHIYGKPFVDAESWTTWRRWKDSPFARKRLVDRAFCEGLNRITYHGYSHSPPEAGLPGRSYHAGIDMNPQVVWWSKARPFMDYLARCCQMLRQGTFVADVAYYYGDQAPNFWPAFQNVPEKPLLPGLGAGYDYDVVNSDVILNRMSVENHRLALPGGPSYQVLVLPDQETMPLEVLRKVATLVEAGATVIGPKPTTVPGLRDHGNRTTELRELADALWGGGAREDRGVHPYGKGTVVWGWSAREWLGKQLVGPDFAAADSLDYIHRRSGDADIYFVRNKADAAFAGDAVFRVADRRTPALWDPADGSVDSAVVHEPVEGGIRVHLDLPPGGSTFVVFREDPAAVEVASLKGPGAEGMPAARLVAGGGAKPVLRGWSNGSYRLQNSEGEATPIEIDDLPQPRVLAGPWTVAFDPDWGAPAKIKLPNLTSWTEHSDEGVRHYSGTGTYTRTLDVPADWLDAGRRVFLDLGDVRELAEVFVNGRSAGVLWKPPFRADVTDLVHAGGNQLKIEVMNLWINRLVADGKLPESERLTRTNIRQGQDWEAQSAGLLGPVRLLVSEEVAIP